jgi:hypothetical protein
MAQQNMIEHLRRNNDEKTREIRVMIERMSGVDGMGAAIE